MAACLVSKFFPMITHTNPKRRRLFEILEAGRSEDWLSRSVDLALIALISVNVLAVILESVPEYQQAYGMLFEKLELFSIAVFTIEYILRVWATVESDRDDYRSPILGRLRYMLTPMALIDLIVIVPAYLTLFVSIDLRFLRVLRLLRVFKLTRYSSSMSLLMNVLAKEARTIGAALFVLLLLVIMSASFVYIAEHAAQPEAFRSIPSSMWWAVITMTSVGYGDVTPVTAVGKLFAAIISIVSIGMVALPAGLLASGFNDALRQRREDYRELVEEVLDDGVLDVDEMEALRHRREDLGLSRKEAQKILDESRRNEDQRKRRHEYEAMVHKVLSDGIVSDEEREELRHARLNLGLNADEADKILAHEKLHSAADSHAKQAPLLRTCPHCGKVIGE
jgi:voltage-gated potassium channel